MTDTEFFPNFISNGVANAAFTLLRKELDWERRPDAPRSEYWWNAETNRSYTYGKGMGERTYRSRASHPLITAIASAIKGTIDVEYKACFLNMYEDETDALGWHADDDPGIDHNFPICVVTLGEEREIHWRPQDPDSVFNDGYQTRPIGGSNPYHECVGCGRSMPAINGTISGHDRQCPERAKLLAKQIEKRLLTNGSLFVMPAGMQSTHFHRIPKGGRKMQPRISLTFRKLLP